MDMRGKVSLVIGGASGIGRAGAEALAARGADIVIGDVQAQAAREVAEALADKGTRAISVEVDVLDDASVQSAVARVEAEFGRLDVLVNSAGKVTRDGEASDAFERNVDMFLLGVWRGTKYGAEAMRRAGGGSIVNIASIAGITGTIGPWGYGAAKHGVVGMTRSAALQYAPENIRINSVCPGHFGTGMNTRDQAEDGGMSFIRDVLRVPMGRWGRLEEIGSAIAFLASDDSSFITGQELVVDGGLTAR